MSKQIIEPQSKPVAAASPPSEYLTPEALVALVEELTGTTTTTRTLASWRHNRQGPPVTRLGDRVFYRRAAFLAWLAEQERPGEQYQGPKYKARNAATARAALQARKAKR